MQTLIIFGEGVYNLMKVTKNILEEKNKWQKVNKKNCKDIFEGRLYEKI
jgi:hypothetical protein